MKFTLSFILLINFSILAISQEPDKFSFLAGIDVTADKIRYDSPKNYPITFNYGVISELQINQKWIIHLNISHYKRTYEEKLLFGTRPYDRLNGTTSYHSELVKEKSIELENLLKYQFLNKKVTPYFGLGYALRFPYSVIYEVKIVYSDGYIENIWGPVELGWSTNFGLYSVIGINYKIIEKLNIVFDFGHKWYLATTSTFNSYIFSFGILYKLK